jgi:glucosamine kinase
MILLADSGSTKTDWLVAGADTASFPSAGINPFYQTSAVIADALRREVAPRVAGAVRQIFFYGAGCADEASSQPVREALAEVFPAAESTEINSDLLAAARALCGHEPGIACILGTGSNNCLYDGEKIVNNIGSLGFWLGDEGSGGYLGKQLVVHYLHRELPAALHEAFRTAYPEVARLAVLDRAYKQPFPNRYFATFTPFLSQYQDEPFVRKMLENAFRAFLKMYVCKHPDARSFPVHFTGSVAYYFEATLKQALAGERLRLGSIQKSPMPGLLRFHRPDLTP